jgi:hypothetical protein
MVRKITDIALQEIRLNAGLNATATLAKTKKFAMANSQNME